MIHVQVHFLQNRPPTTVNLLVPPQVGDHLIINALTFEVTKIIHFAVANYGLPQLRVHVKPVRIDQ